MRRVASACLCVLLLAALVEGAQQRKRDPLNAVEVDQLREVAQDPVERLKLWVKFVRARMAALEQARADSKPAGERGKLMHDLLEDLGVMVDEMDDNVANFHKQRADIRKPLGLIIQMDDEFLARLKALKEAEESDRALARSAAEYKFVLEDTIESVAASAESSRETLEEQNKRAAEAKQKKTK